jgi:hypothetical protein
MELIGFFFAGDFFEFLTARSRELLRSEDFDQATGFLSPVAALQSRGNLGLCIDLVYFIRSH